MLTKKNGFGNISLTLTDYAIISPTFMMITTHTAIGAVIGQAVGHPVLGFILGFISHFIVDMIPHGDSGMADNFFVLKQRRKQAIAFAAIDAIVAIGLVLLLANTKDIFSIRNFTWGIIGGVLPDLLVAISIVYKNTLLKKFVAVHFYFHDYFVKKRGDVPLYYAILAQIVLIAY